MKPMMKFKGPNYYPHVFKKLKKQKEEEMLNTSKIKANYILIDKMNKIDERINQSLQISRPATRGSNSLNSIKTLKRINTISTDNFV